MSIEDLKIKIKEYRDLFGGCITDDDAISKIQTMSDAYKVLYKHHAVLEDQVCDARSHLDNFIDSIGFDFNDMNTR